MIWIILLYLLSVFIAYCLCIIDWSKRTYENTFLLDYNPRKDFVVNVFFSLLGPILILMILFEWFLLSWIGKLIKLKFMSNSANYSRFENFLINTGKNMADKEKTKRK